MNPPIPSNRSFGFLFTVFFGILSIYAAYIGLSTFKIYCLMIAGAIICSITILLPDILTPFNKIWLIFGEVMGKIVSPLVIGIIFFFLISPIAIVTRIFGRDELQLKKKSTSSYWIDRIPHGPSSDSFKNQF